MAGKPVIVGTDGSQESLRAVEWAAREAVLHGLGLHIVSVPDLPPPMAPGWSTSRALASRQRQAAERMLAVAARHAAEADAVPAITTALLAGTPARALVQAAGDAALLVVGSRGIGGFAALLLGSVSRYVATHAPCPVVVAREESMAVHREVVVGVTGPREDSAALEFAFREAALRKARLLALHAWPPPPLLGAAARPAAPGNAPPGSRELLAEADSQLEDLLAHWRKEYPQVQADWQVIFAHPGRVLAGASARADLVVLGRRAARGRHGPGASPVIHAVLGHAHGPVATVPGD